jgi:hypothetical protein
MVEESVEQLKRLHAIEDVEHAIFALERGMPVPPRVIGTMNMLFRAMVSDYNDAYAEKPQQPTPGTD